MKLELIIQELGISQGICISPEEKEEVFKLKIGEGVWVQLLEVQGICTHVILILCECI